MAFRLGIKPEELAVIDRSAASYVPQDKRVHETALKYYAETRAAHRAVDHAIVHDFTEARRSAATAALTEIKERLSAHSFAAFVAYLDTTFRASVKTVAAGEQAK